ncbi:MAG: HPF/RaiA family ribosome-associated protein [Candidatus Babeliales bacterium]
MHKRITFRGMEHSAPMEDYVNQQLAKVEEFLSHERDPRFLDVVLDGTRIHNDNSVEVRVKTPNYDLVSNYKGPKIYDVIDRVIDVMYNELCEAKRKRIDEEKKKDVYKGA